MLRVQTIYHTFPKVQYLSYILVPLEISLALGGSKLYSGPRLEGWIQSKINLHSTRPNSANLLNRKYKTPYDYNQVCFRTNFSSH